MQISSEIYRDAWKEIQREKIKKIIEKIKPNGRILDIGAGPGFLEEYIDAIALDIDLKNLRLIQGEKVLASGDNLPFKEKVFDFIFCIDTIHKLDKEKFFKECKRVLKDNGKLVVGIFCNKWNYNKIDLDSNLFKKEDEFLIKGKEWEKVFVFRNQS